MGNVVNMGYGTTPADPDAPAQVDFVQRLSAQDLKRYTEGFQRICRNDSAQPASATASSGSAIGGGQPPLPPTSMAASKARSGNGSRASAGRAVATIDIGSGSTGGLTKKLFRAKLLSAFPLIPHSLSDRLFEVLDDDRRGELTVESVLRGIALLKHGSKEDHEHLLFTIYDLDTTGLVARDTLDRFMDVVYGRRKARHPTTVAFLDRVFEQRTTLTPEEFREIVHEKNMHGEALLTQWLYVLSDKIGRVDDVKIDDLEKQYNPIVIRHRIAESTLFSTNEVSMLEKQFHKLFDTKGGASNRIPSDQFIDLLAKHEFPRRILEHACQQMTIKGMVLFDECCQLLSNLSRGTVEAKCRHLFDLFTHGDSMKQLSKAARDDVVQTLSDCANNCDDRDIDKARADEELGSLTAPEFTSPWHVEDFVAWSASSSTVQHLLHQMAFVTCILFGVKPDAASLEKKIIIWHWQTASRQIVVGSSWNLLATKWWLQWCGFVAMDPLNGTPSGSLILPRVPRDAVEVGTPERQADKVSERSTATRPGPIANWSLLKRSGSRRLKEKLMIGRDFHLVPSTVYSMLLQWYSGGPDLSRSVVELPNSVLEIELFPLVLRVARVDPVNGGVIMSGEEVLLSSLSSVEGLIQATCKALLLTKFTERSRLWYFDESQPDHKYRLRSTRLRDIKHLTQNSAFLLEVQDDDGSWPLSQSSSALSEDEDDDDLIDVIRTNAVRNGKDSAALNGSRQLKNQTSPQRRPSDICSRGNLESLTALATTKSTTANGAVAAPGSVLVEEEGLATARTLKRRFSRNAFNGSGLVGLDNLGNTCYMSSALQCLSHTQLLVDYFKNEDYLHDINLHNRDGTNGKLAVSFGELLRVLWTSGKKRFAPNEFKRVLARSNPQFVGSDQHDAQELLACLLSGLSEDLNRIVTKPYIEQPDSDGRCDAIVADEWWQNHLKRELSVIVALFTGQYKSLLECSKCHYESARFEPFTFLQLSLPESSFRSIVLTVIFNNGRVPMRFSVRVRKDGIVEDIVNEVVDLIRRMDIRDQILRQRPACVVLARVSSLHTVETILDVKSSLIRIHDRDQLTAFQLDELPEVKSELVISSLDILSQTHDASTTENSSPQSNGDRNEDEDQDGVGTFITSESPRSFASSPAESDRQTTLSEHEMETINGSIEQVHVDVPPLQVGSSVYVRAEKVREFLAARVIGGSSKNGTVDVAYPSGVRRYHIPRAKIVENNREEAFVFLVHRRVERSLNSFTEAHVTRLFGAPLTLRLSLKCTTSYDLYMLVWQRLHRIFNWQAPPSVEDVKASFDDDGRKANVDKVQEIRTDISRMALGQHLTMTKFGFCLRMVTSHGIGCSRCEWIEGCLGCVIVPSPNHRIELVAEETISIDWDIRTLKEEYDPIQASKLDVHESVHLNQRHDNMPLNIARCLDIFTAKEQIQEAYCGRCKTLRPATKTMDLWRLPPILVIQLKRFCYTQTSRRKLHHFVDFPLKGLRLEDFVAKKRDPKRMHESGMSYWQFLGGKLKSGSPMQTTAPSHGDIPDVSLRKPVSSRQTSTTLLEAPATAAERANETFLYDLYAVVNHVGALGAGHYFAYVLSEDDNKWKCFNDHQCKEIDGKEVVSSSAYILFYRRRDMKNVAIEELFPPIRRSKGTEDVDGSLAEQDMAKVEELVEQTKMATNSSGCVIS